MNRYLLDTNHMSEALSRVSVVRDRLQQLHRQGAIFGSCGPVLCELFAGIVQRKDSGAMCRRLEGLPQIVRLWPVEIEVAVHYGELFVELKKSGRALSQVDITLAALCRRHAGLTLLTGDADFQAVANLNTENWLAPVP